MAITAVREYREHSSIAHEFHDFQIEPTLEIAEAVIDTNICGKLRGFDSFSPVVQEKVKKAIFKQTDFILNNFGCDLTSEGTPKSASIGSFSYTLSEEEKDIKPTTLNYAAKLYLSSAGLLYRGDICVI